MESREIAPLTTQKPQSSPRTWLFFPRVSRITAREPEASSFTYSFSA